MDSPTIIIVLLFLNIFIIRDLFNKISNLEDKIDNLIEEQEDEENVN